MMLQQAVKAIRVGQDVYSVAAAYGVNVHSVFRWLADFANGGHNELLAKPIPGRTAKVSDEEMRRLAKAVRNHSPMQFKFAFGLWTLPLIAALIERQFGKKTVVVHGKPADESIGFLGAEAALLILITGCDAGSYLGNRALPSDSSRGQGCGGNDLLCRRIGNPLSLPHRYDLGAAWSNTRCGNERPAFLV